MTDFETHPVGTADLVARLRAGKNGQEIEAADRIEQLEAENKRLGDLYDDTCYYHTPDGRAQFHARKIVALESALTSANAATAAAYELLAAWLNIAQNCEITDGCCCCGDNMENHAEPMDCGHVAVDHGAYVADGMIKTTIAALATPDQIIEIDIRSVFMEEIEKATDQSPWVPKEYTMNEVVSDCCEFLREDRSPQPDSRDAVIARLVETATHLCDGIATMLHPLGQSDRVLSLRAAIAAAKAVRHG